LLFLSFLLCIIVFYLQPHQFFFQQIISELVLIIYHGQYIFPISMPLFDERQLWNLMYSCESLAKILRCVGSGWKELRGTYKISNVDFSLKGGHVKGMKEWSTSTHNHSSMFGWCHFWDTDKHNHHQASMRSFATNKPKGWQCEKGTSTKAMWWLWKVTYAWIREYFRIVCKSIAHIQSNEEIWGEDTVVTLRLGYYYFTIESDPFLPRSPWEPVIWTILNPVLMN